MHTLHLQVDEDGGMRPLVLEVARVYNLGFTIRDPEKMQRHLEEVYKHGVPELKIERPPIIFPISPWTTLTDREVAVQRAKTSGEVEIVTIVDSDGEIYVGVGSDQTDRELEVTDIPWSKQVAPNLLAPTVWRWKDVEAHWDEVTMESDVVEHGTRFPYQRCSVSEFWTPPEMVRGIEGRVHEVEGAKVLFSGTVVTVDEELRFGREWTLRLHDPRRGRTIEHTYAIVVLAEEVQP